MADAELTRLTDIVGGTASERVRVAVAEFTRPTSTQVTGRAGSGRSTVAAALELPPDVETAPIDAPGATDPELDADVVVYVLSDTMQPGDRRALTGLRGERSDGTNFCPTNTLLILNKADAIGADPVARCTEYTVATGLRTLPMIATAADDDWTAMARNALADLIERATASRGGRLLDALQRAAAGADDNARDAIEAYLRGPEAVRLGLDAGLADPAVAGYRRADHVVDPSDATTALAAAGYWRDLVGVAQSAATRRAALRIHRGYAGAWARLAGRAD